MSSSPFPAPRNAKDLERAADLLDALYGMQVSVEFLPSDRDWNFSVSSDDGRWVLKLANPQESRQSLDFEHRLMARLGAVLPQAVPEIRANLKGEEMTLLDCPGGKRWARLLRWLPGKLLAGQAVGADTWSSLGKLLAQVDLALEGWEHPGAHRSMHWDLAQSGWVLDELRRLPHGSKRAHAESLTRQFLGEVRPRIAQLPQQVLHQDANEHNLIATPGPNGAEVCGLFDFGDAVHTARIFELAVAGAYLLYLAEVATQPEAAIEALCQLTAAYHALSPLTEQELLVLFPSCCQRMVISALTAEIRLRANPEHDYASVHLDAATQAIACVAGLSPARVEAALREACGFDAAGAAEGSAAGMPRADVLARRERFAAPMLSLSYAEPLEIVRGRGSYLFDKQGRGYLDCVNNVCHVGHCHPRVVAAASEQMARLNTNTRYLSDLHARYTERLAGLFPDPLEIVFLVNSGSEANELALRLASTATGRRGVIATTAGYHGNTQSLVDVSAYKHDGKGGAGAPDWVGKVDNPDPYRGRFRGDTSEAAAAYAAQVGAQSEALRQRGFAPAAFLIEALPGCGGQNVPPQGYLLQAFAEARAEGALCIADEVQIGFGRVGSHWWAFDEQGAVPDIVTMGKPIGNGHPMGAVITTRAIAEAFHTGMEWFNTFGGNPVSCATGLAVLEVIESEGLRERALRVGELIQNGLRGLAERFPVIGDVRGRGMYLGAEFVHNRETRKPNAETLRAVLESARATGVLLSSDGPDHNVLKIKPPMVFDESDAALMLSVIEHALHQVAPALS
jgi:4-aminobutyrate aminotransferase-like enzyme/Ser/Thr protein kinase RdoA (MazF antagonist)